jgi:hypothetical protein
MGMRFHLLTQSCNGGDVIIRKPILVVSLTSVLLLLALLPLRPMTVEEVARRLETITWHSEEFPSYSLNADEQAKKFSIDILTAAFTKAAKLMVNSPSGLNNLVAGVVRYDINDQIMRKVTTNKKAVVRKSYL